MLKTDWDWIKIVKPPKVYTIHDILSTNEIERILAETNKLRYRVFFLTAYSMGLRLGEAISLQLGDIDAEHKQVHIRRGKGHKDRLIPMPDFTYRALQVLWCKHHNPTFLFPSATGSPDTIRQAKTHMDRGGAQKALKVVLAECGIKKRIHIHSLRHSYATHLLERGVSLQQIQALLGHASINSTLRYTQLTSVTQKDTQKVVNDLINSIQIDLLRRP